MSGAVCFVGPGNDPSDSDGPFKHECSECCEPFTAMVGDGSMVSRNYGGKTRVYPMCIDCRPHEYTATVYIQRSGKADIARFERAIRDAVEKMGEVLAVENVEVFDGHDVIAPVSK